MRLTVHSKAETILALTVCSTCHDSTPTLINTEELEGIYPDKARGGFKGAESCGIVKPANVISISYGSQEPEMTAAYQVRQCNEYAKLGMMGVTVLYSSGDDGVAAPGECINPKTGMSSRFHKTFIRLTP